VAQSFTTNDGITLVNPGTYVSTEVISKQAGVAAAGVVTLIGEADEGPGFQDEADLNEVAFTPDQYGEVLQKYGSGRLVDAFRSIVAAANDPAIVGAVSLVRMVKTNQSAAASADQSRGFEDAPVFAALTAKRRGASGNLIKYRSDTAAAEVAPTTGEFAYCPLSTGSVSIAVRANGGEKQSVTITAKMDAPTLRSLIEDASKGILVQGGSQKDVIPGDGLTLSAAASSSDTLVVTLQSGNQWAGSPAVGDSAVIPANGDYGAGQDSAIAGGAGQNVGAYVVTAVTNTLSSATITLKRISSGSCAADSGSTAVDLTDLILFSPMVIKNQSGEDRGALVGVVGTYNCTSNDGTTVVIETPSGEEWASQPKVGDTLAVPAAFAGIEAGHYQVTASTSSAVTAYRLSEGSAGSTGSEAVALAPTKSTQPVKVLAPVLNGFGKTLAIEGTTSAVFRNTDTTADAGLSNSQKISASELKNQMTYSRGSLSESVTSGGEVMINVGCTEEDATIEVAASKIDFKVSGTVIFSCSLSQFKTLKDVADYASSQTGWAASVASAKFNNVPPSDLDKGEFGASGISSHKNARIKRDAKQWKKDQAASILVSIELVDDSGLPEELTQDKFLSGGAKNGTTSAQFTAAIDKVEKLTTNFIVPLVSQDADADIEDEETESSSTYTVDAVNAYVKAHVIKMSAVKMRKNRSALVSKRGAYSDVKEAAGEMSSFRVAMTFQDVRNVSASGSIKVFQPWMGSVVAAGMQSAAGFRGIVKKFANVTGISAVESDFDPNNPGESEDALKAGLMFMERVPTGGFRWVSDQLTYSVDNNFVYNSLQAVYLSDLITGILIDQFDRLVVGKSVAQITAGTALSILESEMFNFLRLRWIAPSDDAPNGYKNATARLNGGVLQISVEIKLAGLIYFVPIQLSISEVQQTAG
jgi:hypothetical protein